MLIRTSDRCFYRIMHYQGAGILITIGSVALAATYFLMSFRCLRVKSSLGILYLGIGVGLWVFLFITMRWSVSHIFPTLTTTIVTIAIYALFTHYLSRRR